MILIPIESSTVAAIGYAPDHFLLRVLFKDGSRYDYAGTTAEKYAALMASHSKGVHLHEHFRAGVRLTDESEVMPNTAETPTKGAETTHMTSAAPAGVEAASPLVTYGEDECCSVRLAKANPPGDRWVCGKCSTEWRARMIAGIKAWEPFEPVMVFRFKG